MIDKRILNGESNSVVYDGLNFPGSKIEHDFDFVTPGR